MYNVQCTFCSVHTVQCIDMLEGIADCIYFSLLDSVIPYKVNKIVLSRLIDVSRVQCSSKYYSKRTIHATTQAAIVYSATLKHLLFGPSTSRTVVTLSG